MNTPLPAVIEKIREIRQTTPAQRSVLVALSGIDGCGKGYLSARIVKALETGGLRTAGLNIDGWLNLPTQRFSEIDPAGHFYRNALRFDEMFSQLVLPLRDRRSIRLEADHADETATEFRKQPYAFDNIDVIVLEGIYLLRRDLRRHYDLSVWITCTFETALERAIARGQEGLPLEDTIKAYRKIYFPAQEIHFSLDDPQEAAAMTVVNDPRLG